MKEGMRWKKISGGNIPIKQRLSRFILLNDWAIAFYDWMLCVIQQQQSSAVFHSEQHLIGWCFMRNQDLRAETQALPGPKWRRFFAPLLSPPLLTKGKQLALLKNKDAICSHRAACCKSGWHETVKGGVRFTDRTIRGSKSAIGGKYSR